MKWNALAEQSSSLCKALSVIGDRWTLLILNQCFLKLRRYGEIQSSLGLSKPLLAARLKKMVRLGVLKWPSFDGEMPCSLRKLGPRSAGTFHAEGGASDRTHTAEAHVSLTPFSKN